MSEVPEGQRCPRCNSAQVVEHCEKNARCTWLLCKTCRHPFDLRKQAAG